MTLCDIKELQAVTIRCSCAVYCGTSVTYVSIVSIRSTRIVVTNPKFSSFFCIPQEYKLENTFDEDIDFYSLPLRSKILNLHLLCDIRLDSVDVGAIYNCLEAESLRIDPLGYDSKGSTYWYFHGTRLYREDKVKSTNGSNESSVWQVICFTEDDWNKLTNSLNNRRESERALRKVLETEFLPKIPQFFQKKERNRRQK